MNSNNTPPKAGETIGKRIERLRKEQNINQKDLAKKLKSHQSTISQYENNEKSIPSDVIIELANIFNVSCQYLLTGEPNNTLDILNKYIQLDYCTCPVDNQTQEYLALRINEDLINYLYQTAQAKNISKLPNKAREAWYREMRREFNESKHKENFISFIPFPSENISTDNSPNTWNQLSLFENSIIFFKKNFS